MLTWWPRSVGSWRCIGCAFAIILEIEDTWLHFTLSPPLSLPYSTPGDTFHLGEYSCSIFEAFKT